MGVFLAPVDFGANSNCHPETSMGKVQPVVDTDDFGGKDAPRPQFVTQQSKRHALKYGQKDLAASRKPSKFFYMDEQGNCVETDVSARHALPRFASPQLEREFAESQRNSTVAGTEAAYIGHCAAVAAVCGALEVALMPVAATPRALRIACAFTSVFLVLIKASFHLPSGRWPAQALLCAAVTFSVKPTRDAARWKV